MYWIRLLKSKLYFYFLCTFSSAISLSLHLIFYRNVSNISMYPFVYLPHRRQIAQLITNLTAIRPLLDFAGKSSNLNFQFELLHQDQESDYFVTGYQAHIKCFRLEAKLVRDLIQVREYFFSRPFLFLF